MTTLLILWLESGFLGVLLYMLLIHVSQRTESGNILYPINDNGPITWFQLLVTSIFSIFGLFTLLISLLGWIVFAIALTLDYLRPYLDRPIFKQK